MNNDNLGSSESPKSPAANGAGPISLPAGRLTLSSALEHFGRDRFDELLAEFDWDAELTADGDAIVTFTDPRNQTGKSFITREFLSWLKNEATNPSTADDTEVDEK